MQNTCFYQSTSSSQGFHIDNQHTHASQSFAHIDSSSHRANQLIGDVPRENFLHIGKYAHAHEEKRWICAGVDPLEFSFTIITQLSNQDSCWCLTFVSALLFDVFICHVIVRCHQLFDLSVRYQSD